MVENIVKEHIESLGFTQVPIFIQQEQDSDDLQELILIRKTNTSTKQVDSLHECEVTILWKTRDSKIVERIHDNLIAIVRSIASIEKCTTKNYQIHTVISGLPESMMIQEMSQASLGITLFIWYELKNKN